jgi:hypothetical protein
MTWKEFLLEEIETESKGIQELKDAKIQELKELYPELFEND